MRLTGALFFPISRSSPWADEIPPPSALSTILLPGAQHVVSYHLVRHGTCWATIPGVPALCLDAGDVLLVPHGDRYVMASAPELQPDAPAGAAAAFFRAIARDPAAALVGEGGGPSDVELVCGFLGCDLHPSNPLLEGLPRVVHLRRPRLDAAADPLQLLVEFAVAESKDHQAGTLCVLLRLSEVLFVEVIRRYLHGLPEAERTWLSALRDPAVGRALALLHERPGAAWTLEQLARDLGVSRSVLADRFTLFVGQPPMRYLARWRMQLASHRLSDQTAKVAAIALELGYKSEAAFSRAFKRIVGTSPAAWRRQRAQTPAAPALTD